MLYEDVLRGLVVEMHHNGCNDVWKAKQRGFKAGNIEGVDIEDAIANSIKLQSEYGVNLSRDCYRIMPCVHKHG